jgi:perosamine synthetase
MEFFGATINTETKDYVNRILESGFLSEGWMVETFEKELEEQFGMRNVVAVNSGTSALHLALVLAGVGQGDEVILPAQTFIATGLAVLYCGAKPVFADIGMDGNIDPEDVRKKYTEKTKAIMAVSWGGNPCDLGKLEEIRIEYGGWLIQDNAQALGATYYGKDLSFFSHFACYSFQAIKALSTGDGGAVTHRYANGSRARRLRWFGIDRENDKADETGERKYNLKEIGYKYHMNNVAAAIGLGNLHGFKERQERVKRIAKRYDDEIPYWFQTNKKEGCSYWLYDLLVDRRKDFIKAMTGRGVPVSVVHVGIDRNKIFGGKKDLPIQRLWDKEHVCLPIHSSLTDEDVEKVVEAFGKGW